MKKKKERLTVFPAASAIQQGELPKRKDAVEYIKYLRDTLDYFIKRSTALEDELKKRGWTPPRKQWTPISDGTIWSVVSTTTEEQDHSSVEIEQA